MYIVPQYYERERAKAIRHGSFVPMEKVGKKIARLFKVRESKSLPQFHGPLTGP